MLSHVFSVEGLAIGKMLRVRFDVWQRELLTKC